jgi:hypothetical protein
MRKQTLYFLLLALLLTLYVIVEITRPIPVNWTQNFNNGSKSPYGCYVIYDLLPGIFRGSQISENVQSFYVSPSINDTVRKSLIIVTNDFEPDDADLKALHRFIASGSQVFIVASHWGTKFFAEYAVRTAFHYNMVGMSSQVTKYKFTNIHLSEGREYTYPRANEAYFSRFDSLQAEVLGWDKDRNANFLRMKIGKGQIYLHSVPLVFTNFHLLYTNSEYPVRALSYLQSSTIVWDEYYKPERKVLESRSPIRYILSQQPLRYAYFLLVFAIFLFMVFESKRRQRMMPIVEKPRNSSLEFVQIVASLYYNGKDNKDIAGKKIAQFYDMILSNYYLRPNENDRKFRIQFAGKLNVPLEEVNNVFDTISDLKNKKKITDDELIKLVAMIEALQ